MKFKSLGMLLLSLFFLFTSPALAATRSLLVYTALEDDEIPRYLALFKKSHPDISVKIVRDSTGIITAKLLAEKGNPRADLVWGTAATSLMLCDQAGMVEPYAPAGIDRVIPKMKDHHSIPHWVGIKAWMTGFCVNTMECQDFELPCPQSFEDLLNPVYKGHLVMPNPASSGTGFLTVSALLQLKGEKEGWAFLDKLHANIARYTHSGSKPCKIAGSGELPIGISFAYRGFVQHSKGEPVKTIFPKEGSGWDVEANCLIKKDKINPAAKTFLDWAISEPVMKEYAQVYPVTAYATGTPIPDGFPMNPSGQLIENDFQWAAENRRRILKEWHRRYDNKSDER